MKKILMMAAAAIFFIGSEGVAQDVKVETDVKKDRKKLKEYDEIIIKRKNGDKDSKVTIEIKDDEVFVDGKPIDEYAEEDISVRKRGATRFRLDAPGSPFRFEQGWSLDGDDEPGLDKPFLGVTSEGSTEGVRVTSVSENSAAAKAGIVKGDIITKINDKAVFDHEQLSEAISAFEPNEKITIAYKRNGKENKATATLGKRPRARTLYGAPHPPNAPEPPIPPVPVMPFDMDSHEFGDVFSPRPAKPKLGIKVQDTEDGKGVKVLEVEEGSAAETAGIKKDDIITSFEGKEVNNAGDLAKASREAKDKTPLKVQLSRNGKSQNIDVKIPKKLRTANL